MRDWIEDREMLRRLEVILGEKPRYVGGDYLTITLSELDRLMRYIDRADDHIETLQAELGRQICERLVEKSECEEQARLDSQRSMEDE